jgi:hypothetical protein
VNDDGSVPPPDDVTPVVPAALLSPVAAVAPVELEATWGRAVRVWWAVTWRSLLLAVCVGAGLGCCAGGFIGVLGAFVGASQARVQEVIQLVTLPIGALMGLLAGMWATRVVLRKKFRHFRIALIERSDGQEVGK